MQRKDFMVFNSHKQCQSAMSHSSSPMNLLMICTAASCYDLMALYIADTAITINPAPPHWAKKHLYLYCNGIYCAALRNGNMALYEWRFYEQMQ